MKLLGAHGEGRGRKRESEEREGERDSVGLADTGETDGATNEFDMDGVSKGLSGRMEVVGCVV